MAVVLFDKVGGVLGMTVFDTTHLKGRSAAERRSLFMSPFHIESAMPWTDLNTAAFSSPDDELMVTLRYDCLYLQYHSMYEVIHNTAISIAKSV